MSREHTTYSTETCFFCGRCGPGDALRNVSTFDVDFHVRQCALKLQDKPLLAKLGAGDFIAQEAKYHPQCLASLYNKARDPKAIESHVDSINHGIAFAGLVSYTEEVRMDSLVAPMFKLTDLVNLYHGRLDQLGMGVYTSLNSRIEYSYFPDMDAHKQGRDVVLICNEDIGTALKKACECHTDMDAVHLAEAA